MTILLPSHNDVIRFIHRITGGLIYRGKIKDLHSLEGSSTLPASIEELMEQYYIDWEDFYAQQRIIQGDEAHKFPSMGSHPDYKPDKYDGSLLASIAACIPSQ